MALEESIFSSPFAQMVLKAHLAGHCPGRIWKDGLGGKASLMMWNGGHCLLTAGEPGKGDFLDTLKIIRDSGISTLIVSSEELSWEDQLPSLLPGGRWARKVFLRHYSGARLTSPDLPLGYALIRLDSRTLLDGEIVNMESVRHEVRLMWPSLDRFLAHGFGSVVLQRSTVVSWCTAEYVSSDSCGIGIETVPEHRRLGLGKAAAVDLLMQARERGLTPHWDAWENNLPSLGLARGIGFEVLSKYRTYVVQLS